VVLPPAVHRCQLGKKRLDLVRAHVARVAHGAAIPRTPANEKTNPIQVSLLSLEAIVQKNAPAPGPGRAGGLNAKGHRVSLEIHT
jgi:hypothetical protein